MEAKLCIYICNSLVPEVHHLLHSGNYPDVTLKSFPSVCIGSAMSNNHIMKMVADDIDQFSKIIIFLSACRGNKKVEQSINKKIEIIQLEQCFELFFNSQTIYHFIKQGNYLVTNGWLRNYQQHIREWGFSAETAKIFFGESIKKILLLETGLPGDYQSNLEALSVYMGLPFEILPIGNSHLQKYIESIIFDWRNENERIALNERIASSTRESADNALMFYHLQKLIDHTDETVIIQEIIKLTDLLFAPEQIIYQQIKNSEISLHFLKPNEKHFNFNTANSLELDINYANEAIGILGISGIKFPDYIPKYQSMSAIICQMGGLAISNARKFTILEQAKLDISKSEEQFHSLFNNMAEGVALHKLEYSDGRPVDYRIIDTNAGFGEILGIQREKVIGQLATVAYQTQEPPYLKEYVDVALNKNHLFFETYFPVMDKYFAISVVPWQDNGFATIFTDITERKKSEETLHKLSQAVEQSPVSAVITNLNGDIEYGNPVVSEITGYTLDELVGKNPRIFSSGEKSPDEYKNLWETINSGKQWKGEFHNKKKNGELYWESALISPIKNNDGRIIRFLAIKEDITEKKLAARKIAESNQKFKNLSQSATEMLNLKSVEEIYEYITKALHKEYPYAVILFNEVKLEEQFTRLINIKGIPLHLIDKVYKISGFKLENHRFKLENDHLELFKTGSFHHFRKGLSDFSGNEFPKLAAKAIETLLGIRDIYTIGINKDNKIFAAIHFFNRGKESITDNEYIESFVKQAGIVIERKLAEEQLRISEEKYRLLTENASDVIWIFNISKQKFTYISPAIMQLRGLTPDEALAERLDEALTPESANFLMKAFSNNYSSHISSPEKQNFFINQIQQPCKDGSIIWVEVSTKFRNNANGEVEVIGVSRNIEKRKKLEFELRDINATKDKFFSIISHDLRSPFSSVVSLLNLLAENSYSYSPDQINHFAQSALKTSQTTYQLLENLLEWSRLQRGALPFQPENIILIEFLKTCDPSTFEMAKKKQIAIDFDFPNELMVQADSNMLHSIMRNLVTNAIKFTNQGGKIMVKAEFHKEDMVLISIKDNGIGMDKTRLNDLFNVGKNVSRPGTDEEPSSGLGLILCKEFVEKQGGTIWVESEVGSGSTFYFTLPQKIEND